MSSILKLNYFDIKRKLDALERKGFSNLSIPEITVQMRQALKGHVDGARSPHPGPHLYRARKMTGLPKPTVREGVSYPPTQYINVLGRCNRAGEQIFYGSYGILAALLETQVKEGDVVALGKWQLVGKVWLMRAGYSEKSFRSMSSHRTIAGDVDTDVTKAITRSKAQELINDFLSDQFTKVDSQDAGSAYKVSISIFDIMVRSKMMDGDRELGISIDGLNYPSVVFKADTSNLAMLPASADRALRLVSCDMIVMGKIEPDEIHLQYQDHARARNDGSLVWEGRPPAWCSSCSGDVVTRRGTGDWRVYDQQGRELDI